MLGHAQKLYAGRKIVHIDMDAFYASVEQRDVPSLKGRPVVVGGDPRSRSVVCSASYEARKFGVRSAMPCATAKRLCPDAVFIPPHFEKYHEVSETIHALFREVTPMVEPLSLDEAYLDVTQNSWEEPLAGKVALRIQKEIFKRTQLTASAGVAPSKFLAKIASDLKKPNGIVIIPPELVSQFVDQLAIEKLWGVGPKTAERLGLLGIKTAMDIRTYSVSQMELWFGKFGRFLHELSHGIDDRPVVSEWDPKSRGTERTFDKDTCDFEVLENTLDDLAVDVSRQLKDLGRFGRTLTLKVKFHDFVTITRSVTIHQPFATSTLISSHACALLKKTAAGSKPVRLLGISIKGFEKALATDSTQLLPEKVKFFIGEQLEFDLPVW